ncbi:hypothetical protein HUJ05_011967 [Dendroctonus ponderosae]|nr:hypothetical protein HUJ05_011966 [Dendroctonus ponderosae]KAH1012890.1 hypothetical protein HUJ05_011967 [Dendroctonus ponderosae]
MSDDEEVYSEEEEEEEEVIETEAIRKTFGEEEMKIYEDTKRNVANGSLDMLTLNKTLETVIPQASEDQHENVRKKKHVRKFRKKKKPCKCRRKIKHLAKKIPLKQVPDFLIGFADYHENEPIIIANSL